MNHVERDKMQTCFICKTLLTESNASDEHIILNALGGHIHSQELLCKACNALLGYSANAELARELEFCASYLDIPRQRGEKRRIETDKEVAYHLLPGGKLELKKPQLSDREENGKKYIDVVSRNEAEARKILKGLQKKYPEIDVEQTLQQAVKRREYLHEKVSIILPVSRRGLFVGIFILKNLLWKQQILKFYT